MTQAYTRFKERVTPFPQGTSNVKWGEFFVEQTPGKGDWKKISTFNSPIDYPYRIGESMRDSTHYGPPYKAGGPFQKIKIEYDVPGDGISARGQYITNFPQSFAGFFGRMRYVGGFGRPNPWGGTLDSMSLMASGLTGSSLVPSTASLDSGVWDRTKPKIEQGGLFVAIAEIRDIPHMLEGSAKFFHSAWKLAIAQESKRIGRAIKDVGWHMSPKGAAQHFLNHNFGWVPFVKDVVALLDNVINAKDKIARLKRENGQWIRRRTILVNNVDDVVLARGTGPIIYPLTTFPFNDMIAIDGTGHYLPLTWENRVRTWTYATSVGSFRYYLPEFDNSLPDQSGLLGDIRRHLAIHGARINPSNLYKAVPWTWLIDWVSDIGKSIQAIQDATLDNMAARYLFLVHHQIKTFTMRQFVPFNAVSGGNRTLEYSQIIDVKQRKEADSPFGFGLSWDNLTPKQLAILGALGITRHH